MTPAQSGQTVRCSQCQKIFTTGAAAPGHLQYAQPAPPTAYNPLAIASLVCGAVSIFGCFCCVYVSWTPGIAAIVLGIISLQQMKQSPSSARPLAITGICLGSVGIFLPIGTFALALLVRK
jgi:hypothetical protein